MKQLNFKYEIGDKVYKISQYSKEIHTKCGACGGTSRIHLLDGTTCECPKCRYTHGYIVTWENQKWQISETLTIGQQRVEINKAGRKNKTRIKECYMCEETGVGSGDVHNVESLFSTEEEALAECEKLNTKNTES